MDLDITDFSLRTRATLVFESFSSTFWGNEGLGLANFAGEKDIPQTLNQFKVKIEELFAEAFIKPRLATKVIVDVSKINNIPTAIITIFDKDNNKIVIGS